MLDPRLVPWPAVALGVLVAALLAAPAFFLWKRRLLALSLITFAPVAGWAAALYKLEGWPGMPPGQAPLWSFYFGIAGAIVAVLGIWKSGCIGCIGPLARLFYFPALWFGVFLPVMKFSAGNLAWKALAFILIAAGLMGLWHKRAGRWPAAEYTPWMTGLTAASICLSLTGTASMGMLALALCFAAMPSALVMLADSFRRYHIAPELLEDDTLTPTAVEVIKQELVKERRAEAQAFSLPLAFAMAPLVCSGPLYASTGWGTACLLLATPVAGLLALRVLAGIIHRKNRRGYVPGRPWKLELVAIAIALVVSLVPAVFACIPVVKAAAEDPYY